MWVETEILVLKKYFEVPGTFRYFKVFLHTSRLEVEISVCMTETLKNSGWRT
jgi:hypothetical protein